MNAVRIGQEGRTRRAKDRGSLSNLTNLRLAVASDFRQALVSVGTGNVDMRAAGSINIGEIDEQFDEPQIIDVAVEQFNMLCAIGRRGPPKTQRFEGRLGSEIAFHRTENLRSGRCLQQMGAGKDMVSTVLRDMGFPRDRGGLECAIPPIWVLQRKIGKMRAHFADLCGRKKWLDRFNTALREFIRFRQHRSAQLLGEVVRSGRSRLMPSQQALRPERSRPWIERKAAAGCGDHFSKHNSIILQANRHDYR